MGVGVGLWWRGREGERRERGEREEREREERRERGERGEREGEGEGEGEGERERERERERVEGGAMGMRWQCQLINTCVWLLEVREVTVTLVTSLRREGIREATKTLL